MEFQFTLDYDRKLPPSAQLGMAQADANADARWKHIWGGCVLAAARRLATLTSDDVLEEFEKLKDPPTTHTLSAIGPAMQRAVEMGEIISTGQFARSTRKEKRGNLHRVYVSKYFEATL